MRYIITATCCGLGLLGGLGDMDTCRAEELVGRPAADHSEPTTPPPPIATFNLATGSVVQFLDLGEGRAGVAEHAAPPAPLVTDLLVKEWDATPLEIFLAIAPSGNAPELLRRDHAATTSTPPRRLRIPAAHGVPIDIFNCDPPENFEYDWHDTYDGVMQVVVAESYYDFGWTEFDWWPGLAAYKGTNDNLATHFGLCNGDEDASFSVRVDRRIKYFVDGVQHTAWAHKVTATFGYKGRFTFHTNMPGIFRMRLFDPTSTPISQLAAGAAYNKAPPIGIGVGSK
jgi:hypothetical protein